MNLDSLKQEVAAAFDEIELLDFLDIEINELVELLEDIINERKEDFRAHLNL